MEYISGILIERVYNVLRENELKGHELRNNPTAISLHLEISYKDAKKAIEALIRQGRARDTGYCYLIDNVKWHKIK